MTEHHEAQNSDIEDRVILEQARVALENRDESLFCRILDQHPRVDINLRVGRLERQNLLHLATEQRNTTSSMFHILHHPRVDINAKDDEGRTALHLAVGDTRKLRVLFAWSTLDVNVQDDKGATALWRACFQIHEESVDSLLAHRGKDINLELKGNFPQPGQDEVNVAVSTQGTFEISRARHAHLVDTYMTALDMLEIKCGERNSLGAKRVLELLEKFEKNRDACIEDLNLNW